MSEAWRGRSVLVTGHTGFKGGWLSLWLASRGALVHGLALDPPTTPNLFEIARVRESLASDARIDVADAAAVRDVVERARPSVVLHLAAQPLVRESYRSPLRTIATNVLGVANVLEAARAVGSVEAIVVVTTDKVYENREWLHPYREPDRLGGRDPYSASKAAAELVAAAYRESFLVPENGPRMATARAGNVVGGGDFSADRLVPDCMRAFARGERVSLRYPRAVRPWQHVLEPLRGYMRLAEALLGEDGARYARAWNFGPDLDGDATVGAVARLAAELWGPPAGVTEAPRDDDPHEAGILRLDSAVARLELGWRGRWDVRETLAQTVAWSRAWLDGADMRRFTLGQIADYGRETAA